MSFRWSFSTDKLFRRCQRQFFFREIAAHHSQKEPWRREAFVLKQLKTLELWRGSVIHEGIQYPVTNQDDIRFSYRFVEVDGELGAGSDDPDLAAKNLNLLAKKVAFG